MKNKSESTSVVGAPCAGLFRSSADVPASTQRATALICSPPKQMLPTSPVIANLSSDVENNDAVQHFSSVWSCAIVSVSPIISAMYVPNPRSPSSCRTGPSFSERRSESVHVPVKLGPAGDAAAAIISEAMLSILKINKK